MDNDIVRGRKKGERSDEKNGGEEVRAGGERQTVVFEGGMTPLSLSRGEERRE